MPSKASSTRTSAKKVAKSPVKTVAAKRVAKAPAKTAKAAKPAKAAKGTARGPASKSVGRGTPAKVAKGAKKPATKKTVPVKKAPTKNVTGKKPAPAKKVAVKAKKPVKPLSKQAGAKPAAKKATAKTAAKAPAKKAVPKKPPIQTKAAPVRFLEPLASAARHHNTSLAASTIDKLREQLLAEREMHGEQARALAAEAEDLANEREPGDTQFDEESGEGDTLTIERERDLALSATARQTVEDIEKALARMDADRYGYCEMCGDRIPIARLEAIPWADLCVRCKSRGERRR